MSKSKGNFFMVRDAAKQFGYETIRMFMLSAHYRTPLNYSAESLEMNKASLARLYEARNNMEFRIEKASGDTMTFSRTLVCSATAYSIGTRTASGRPTAVGNIAVDTSVFPYGTRMYVQTVKGSWHYGMATAADCGTAIKGNKIDLWFRTYSEACDWGRRDCTVYVLD